MVDTFGTPNGLVRAFHRLGRIALQPQCPRQGDARPVVAVIGKIDRGPPVRNQFRSEASSSTRAPLWSPIRWSDLPKMEWANAVAAGSSMVPATARQRLA